MDKLSKWKAVEANVAQFQNQITEVVRLGNEQGWTDEHRQQLKNLGDSMRAQIEALRKDLKDFETLIENA